MKIAKRKKLKLFIDKYWRLPFPILFILFLNKNIYFEVLSWNDNVNFLHFKELKGFVGFEKEKENRFIYRHFDAFYSYFSMESVGEICIYLLYEDLV